ncbi:hypothetical protein AAG906_015680 [Vitis piasezkii]
MAAPSAMHGSKCTVRSISLPTRLHPHSLRIEAELNKLKAWEVSCASVLVSPGAETIQIGLAGVMELYNYVEELIHSPLTRQALLCHQHRKLVEEALDGSVTLLDACGTAKDILLMTNEHVQDLQSALRRRVETQALRKVKKDISKCLGALQRMESRLGSSPVLHLDHHLAVVVRLLREVSGITISTFRSLLLFFSMPAVRKMFGGWSLITKLIPMASGKGQKIVNEVGSVDVAIHTLQEQLHNSDAKVELQVTQRRLEALNFSIEGLEAGVNCMYRCLIQNRVSLLNVLTQ